MKLDERSLYYLKQTIFLPAGQYDGLVLTISRHPTSYKGMNVGVQQHVVYKSASSYVVQKESMSIIFLAASKSSNGR